MAGLDNATPPIPLPPTETEQHLRSLKIELRNLGRIDGKFLTHSVQGGRHLVQCGLNVVLQFTAERPEHVRLARLCIAIAAAGGAGFSGLQTSFNDTFNGGFDLRLASPLLLEILTGELICVSSMCIVFNSVACWLLL